MRLADERLVTLFVKLLSNIAGGSSQFIQYELHLITYTVRLLQIFEERRMHVYDASYSFPSVPIATIRNLLVLLVDKQKKPISVSEDKATKKLANLRERNAAFHRATNALVSYLQASAIGECCDSILSRPNLFSQLYKNMSSLVSHLQLQRLEAMRDDAAIEDGSNYKSASDLKEMVIGGNKSAKDTKKRCQDLINKPMEFCRNAEGFVVQVKVVYNCYYGL